MFHIQGQRRCPSKMEGRAKLCLETNPIPSRDAQKNQTKLVCIRTQRTHRDWLRAVVECLLWRHSSAVGCCRDRDSGYSRPAYDINFLGGGHHEPRQRAYTGLGKQTLGGHKQKLLCARTQKKGALTPQETNPNIPLSVQEAPLEASVRGGMLQGWGPWVQQCVHGTSGKRLPLSPSAPL